jgi:ABC-type lipoprotein export system ATPase subunit
MQLPQAYVQNLDMHGRVKVRLEEDHVSVWPALVQALSTEEERVPAGSNGPDGAYVWRRPGAGLAVADDYGMPEPVVEQEAVELPPAVETHSLSRTFNLGVEEIHAVDKVSVSIPAGAMVAVKGPSGSGKTTLLNLIAGLDEPTSGEIYVAGRALAKMSSQEKIELRRRQIGFVFQTFGLLPFLSARENVEVPLRLVRAGRQERRQRVEEVLALVGLTGRANHRAFELSGGEQQRVALARALVNRPALILADEPTGQLDSHTGATIIALLRRIADETGVTVLIASHDPKVEEAVDVVYTLRDGRVEGVSG